MIDYSLILMYFYNDCNYYINNSYDYNTLVWQDQNKSKPTKEHLDSLHKDSVIRQDSAKKINELKKLLSDSDFRMTQDYYSTMSDEQKLYWTNNRQSWREEIYLLESKLK